VRGRNVDQMIRNAAAHERRARPLWLSLSAAGP
jgi:hypothetical protein